MTVQNVQVQVQFFRLKKKKEAIYSLQITFSLSTLMRRNLHENTNLSFSLDPLSSLILSVRL